MIFKSFSHISRHTVLAKTLWASSGTSSQPAFFATTNQLARQQSQLVPRNNACFTQSDQSSSSSTNPNGYSALCNSSSSTTLSPLSTLDDDKRREAILAESTGSGGSYLMHNHQHSLSSKTLDFNNVLSAQRRRCSVSSLDEYAPLAPSVRRYSTSRSKPDNANISNLPKTPPSSPVSGPINVHTELSFSEPSLLKLDNSAIESIELSINQTEVTPSPSSTKSLTPSDTVDSVISESEKPLSVVEDSNFSPISSTFTNYTSIQSQSSNKQHSGLITPQDEYNFTAHQTLFDDLTVAIDSGSYTQVIDTFRLFKASGIEPSLDCYEKALEFLSRTILTQNHSECLSNVLSIYMELISKRITPTTSIYSSVLISLLSLADHTSQHKEGSLAYFRLDKRLGNDILPSVQASLQNGDSSVSLYKTALDIFEASNSVSPQKYSTEVYQQVLDACLVVGNYSMIYKITRMLEISNCTWTPDIFISLIKGYGLQSDISAAVETYKHYKALSGNLVNKKEFEIYAALIGAYFDSGRPDQGLTFLNKILDSNTDPVKLAPVLSEIVTAYSRIGDYDSALSWIQRIEGDEKLHPIKLESLVRVLSASSDAGDINTCRHLFDFMASKQVALDPEFNVSRNDFLAVCVKSADSESLFKAIKETQLREGVWELSTVIVVAKYLLQVGDFDFALKIFNIQTKRYLDYMSRLNMSTGDQAVDALNTLVRELETRHSLTPFAASTLMSSACFDTQVFSDVNGGGIACVKRLWKALTDGSIRSILADTPYLIVDIIATHLKWIRASGANNSLGGLAIPSSLLDDLRINFAGFVRHLITISPPLNASFKKDVADALDVLSDSQLSSEWYAYCESLNIRSMSNIPDSAPSIESRFTSNQIILASQNPNTLNHAYEKLQEAITRGENLGADPYVALIEAASAKKNRSLIKSVYKIALSNLPHPSNHSGYFEAWVSVHRAVVRTANIDFEVAQAAYKHLLELGVYPDATGYGQLISNSPVSDNHDEATDALWMFNEAKSNHVQLNTFLCNVVISKLSKARRLKEAITFFKDMDNTNTKKSNVTYGTMISACCRCGDEAAAKAFFEEMEASPTYSPKIAPFNIMLQFYVHTKRDRKSALQVYSHLREIGLKPSSHTYKLLIDAYSTIAPVEIEAADNVLLSIVSDHSAVTSKHYASLLYARGVCMKNQIAAQEFYNALVLNNRVRPDKHIFQALLESYVVNKSVRSTPGVLKDMVSYGVDLDAYMANILIRGWAPVNLDKARGLFNHILQAGITEPSSFESIIRAYLYYGDLASAHEMLHLMVSHLYPEPVVAKIQALINAHSTQTTRLTEEMLLESVFRQDSYALNGLSGTNRQQKHEGQVPPSTEVFDSMPSVSSRPVLVEY